MRLLKIFSFLVLMILASFITTGVVHAAITVEGPFTDTTTQGDWRKTYAAGGSCFYLLPQPPPQTYFEFDLNITTPPPVCVGGSLATSGKLGWDIFTKQGEPIYVYYFDPAVADSKTMPGADQWNPCINDFFGATFDNGDLVPPRGIFEPLVSMVTVDYTGSFRIAYYFLEESINCREQEYKLFVNDELKASGMVSIFKTGKYAYFNINGLVGTSKIRLEVVNTKVNPACNYGNVHFSGIFIDKCNNQFQGCTPGYWKQSQHFGSWTNPPYSQSTKFLAVFGKTITVVTKNAQNKKITVTNPTLLQALNAEGGGVNAIARHATAALLNAANPNVAFPRSEAQIISMVKAALSPGGDIEGTKNKLAEWNESNWNGIHNCPLGRNP